MTNSKPAASPPSLEAPAEITAATEEPYERLSPNVESCINTLLMFVEDRWPEHYREGALRSLRRTVNEWIAEIKAAPPPPANAPAEKDCPCGNPIIREGVTVKSHWTGSICEDCEAVIFQRFNERHAPLRKPFFPDLLAADVVERINLSHVEPLESEADVLFLRKGDRIQRWHVSHGGKSIVVVYIDRTEYPDVL